MIRILVIVFLAILVVSPVSAFYDPASVPNNKFGMHIADFNDIADVATLVNSQGGDWGYITLVASDNDRDSGRWQRMFDQMRRLHLIPIVRLATRVQGDHWVKPDPGKFDEIVSFFLALRWPTENRYIVLYNEPNHAKEWGNEIDPEGYARIFADLSRKFKAASGDFFMLPAGLDVSAASDGQSLEAASYLRRMIAANPDVLSLMDGWSSHSYPNPGFSGSPQGAGRGTVRSYAWELSLLRELGLKKSLPVFITETGWVHSEGKVYQGGLLSSEQVGRNFQTAAATVWNDPQIVAVTPFVFNYQDVPFDTFSWKRMANVGGYYPQYDAYKSITKVGGTPKQKEAYKLSDILLPITLVAGSTYTLSAQVTNTGEGILTPDGYELVFDGSEQGFSLLAEGLPALEPGEKGTLTIHLRAPTTEGIYRLELGFRRYGRVIPLQTQDIRVVPPPAITIHTSLGWRRTVDANDVTVLVYDETRLIHKFTGMALKDGSVTVDRVNNIVPGRTYRTVILVPYYLPRQVIGPLDIPKTEITMKRMIPIDFNQDGTFTLEDLSAMIQLKPNFIAALFVGK
ncbi:MAG: hypothetical protein CV087_08010 [Candidatus Brocadia sp. WS118]|nr:MAG: hypothetical protein CV087_08010 [Candidatus Brocadia sp. WS118]